ncbi:YesL family protein [Amphibacillus sp. Q70]|uniref:YesL family protein n=1 Tax=Amphibacillus sp. Q70 TaxID=3453416 RepID=UPI003F87071B
MAQTLYKITEWISRLAILNLLWLGFTLLGLGIFGLFPATVAMFVVIRRWIRNETDLPIFRTYWKAFREEFLKANGYGSIIFLIGVMIYADLIFMSVNESTGMLFIHIPLYMFLIFVVLTLLYLFPVYVHYDLSFFKTIQHAFLIMMIHPLHNVAMIIGIAATVVVMNYIPGLTFFFGGSFMALLLMGTSYHTFLNVEQKSRTT